MGAEIPTELVDLWFRDKLDDVFRILYRLIVDLTRLAARSGRAKDLKIMLLRPQLAVLQRNTKPPNDDGRHSLPRSAEALPRANWHGWLVAEQVRAPSSARAYWGVERAGGRIRRYRSPCGWRRGGVCVRGEAFDVGAGGGDRVEQFF